MKNFNLVIIVALFLFSFSCSKNENKSGTLTMDTLSAKWVVSGTSTDFVSFEFNKSGNYVVVENDGTKSTSNQIILYGTYQIVDNQTISLAGFGTLKLTSIDSNSFAFTLTLQSDSGTKIVISAAKAAVIANSAKTDLLCKTWEMVTYMGASVVGTEYEGATVLFSSFGTYYVNYPDYPEDGGLAQWTWKDNAETTLCYSWEGDPTCNGENEVQVTELTANSLIVNEAGDISVLKPATVTKSVLVKSFKTKTLNFKRRSLFNK